MAENNSKNEADLTSETVPSEVDIQSLIDTDTSERQTDSPAPTKSKVDILLKATGNAPIMKKKKWTVDPEKKIGWVIEFIRKYLKLDPSESLFLYVNQSFAPAPDQTVKNLFECFGTDGRLILHYCKSQAWG